MMCVYAVVILSVISGVAGGDVCNGMECLQCLNHDQCTYIGRFRAPNLCIQKSEIHDFRFKAIISDPERCGKVAKTFQRDNEVNEATSPLSLAKGKPTITEPRSAPPKNTWIQSLSSTTAASTPYMSAHKPEPITPNKNGSEDGIMDAVGKDYRNSNPAFVAPESSSTTEQITSTSITVAPPHVNNLSNFTMNNSSQSSFQPNQVEEEEADVYDLDIFSFTVPDQFDCNASGLKTMLHYPIAIRTAFSMCRSIHLLQKLQLKTSLTKDLVEWIRESPAHKHERHCSYLIYYKKNCGRKFA